MSVGCVDFLTRASQVRVLPWVLLCSNDWRFTALARSHHILSMAKWKSPLVAK